MRPERAKQIMKQVRPVENGRDGTMPPTGFPPDNAPVSPTSFEDWGNKMRDAEKPDWWPKCPYPEDIFPMQPHRYEEIVPDPEIRTALSGCLGRKFWEIASDAIWNAFCAVQESED